MGISGSWGFYLHDLLRERKGDFAFIDIGANFGLYTSIAVQLHNCKIAVAIEPNPSIFRLLESNVAANQDRTTYRGFNCAIDTSNGIRSLAFNRDNLGKANLRGQGSEIVDIECRNFHLFDEIKLLTKDLPVIVKIDVEGFEPRVIQEIARSQLKDNIDCVFIEISPFWVSKKELDEMFALFSEMGFMRRWKSRGNSQYDVLYVKKKR